MSKNKNSTKQSEHIFLKLLGLLLLVTGLCFGGLTAWRYLSGQDTPKEELKDEVVAEKEATDVLEDEATGETTEGDDNKTQAVEEENGREELKTDENGLKIATVNLTVDYTDGVATAHGTITNLVEEGGACTYTFSGPNGKVISEKTDTITDFHGTLCKSVEFAKAELGAGAWKVTLKYKSNSAEGESEAKTFTVQ